jgi:hypothetical protein
MKSSLVVRASDCKCTSCNSRGGGHEREISNAGRYKLVFAERDERKPVLLGLSLAGNLVKPLLSLYGTEWRERGYGLRVRSQHPSAQ